jgi:hypothetical protein
MKCWNCLRPISKKDHVCHACGQATKPNPMQSTTAKSRLEYLLHESSEWTFLPPEVRQGLSTVYQGRLDRLESLDSRKSALWPESDWSDPLWTQPLSLPTEAGGSSPRTVMVALTEKLDRTALDAFESAQPVDQPATPLAAVSESPPLERHDTVALSSLVPPAAITEEPSAAPAGIEQTALVETAEEPVPIVAGEDADPLPVRQAALARLSEPQPASVSTTPEEDNLTAKILAEADVRWFHSLGALLVVAAVVGWLRATWDGYGKNLAGFMILLSPAALHAVAYQMRASVPISARLLSILAGLLTAPALLAVEIFDFLPPAVPGKDYWTFAFLVSGSLLAWQAQAMREKVPLYVGALCMVMAGWSQGALVTSALCLMVGFLLGPIKVEDEASTEEREWKIQLQRVGFAAGLFGCFSTLFLFRPEHGSMQPLLAFAGALLYLHLPTLTRQSEQNSANRVALQACVTVLGILLMRAVLDVPASGVGLYTLLAAGLFLSARPEHEGGLLALRIGSFLGLAGLAMGFFTSTPLPLGAPDANPAETVMRFVLALVGAGLFGYLSRQTHLESQMTFLGVAALFSTFGGWYHLFLMFCHPVNGSYFAQNGQLAPLFGSFGLWVALWLVGSRCLRPQERDLVAAVTMPVMLASVLACAISGLGLGPVGQIWAPAILWLGAVSLAWDRGLLVAPRTETPDSPAQIQGFLLPRLALWALALGAAFTGVMTPAQLPLPLQMLGLVLLLSPAVSYRQPGLEMVWLVAPAAFAFHWSNDPFPGQLMVIYLLCVAGWAAGPARSAALVLAAGVGFGVVVASLTEASHLALLSVPLVYALCLALPVPGRGEWTKPEPAQFGFDLLLNACLFFPLQVASGSAESFAVTVAVPVLAFIFGAAARNSFSGRFVSPTSAQWLLLVGFIWSLWQGPQESGLLLLLASAWAFTLKQAPVRGLQPWDMANGLAILGAGWLLGESHLHPSLAVLATGVLVSECVALVSARWRPDISNTAFMLGLIVLSSLAKPSSPEVGIALLAGMVGGVRGLATTNPPLMAAGMITFLKVTDGQIALVDASFKVRLLPLAAVLIGASFWMLMRPEHPTRLALGFHPMASLRTGIALLALPPLITLAIFPTITDFAWVLAVGCSCLALSQGFAGYEELRVHLKQAGGYVLTGWVAVSLGRAAMVLPWMLSTLVVGLVLVGAGVKAEKNRKKSVSGGE